MDFKRNALKKIHELGKLIGNTPLIELENGKNNIYAKLEYKNFSGSIKDRAVNSILYNAIMDNKITEGTKIVESSSGNFAISLAAHCNNLGLETQIIVDLNTNKSTNKKLVLYGVNITVVEDEDETGGYLLNRIKKVNEIVKNDSNAFWTNQYENENNYKGYFDLAEEISEQIDSLDYLFIAVSTCGTIVGLSKYLKLKFPKLKIIGVDIEGSMIFNSLPKKRYIPGIGSSRKPFFPLIDVDDFIIISHSEIIKGCHTLLEKYGVFVGGSSGASYQAALNYLDKNANLKKTKSLLLFPDSGDAYIDTIFNREWSQSIIKKN